VSYQKFQLHKAAGAKQANPANGKSQENKATRAKAANPANDIRRENKAVRANPANVAAPTLEISQICRISPDGLGMPKFNPERYRPATPATTQPIVSKLSPHSPLSPRDIRRAEKRELHFEDIMGLPIRPCTTCGQLHWHTLEYENDDGRIRKYRARLCDHYGKRIAEPTRGSRCTHFEGRGVSRDE
jgi:hypothetical protein